MDILFLQFPEDVPAATARAGGSTTLLAVNADVMWALEKRSTPARIGLDFYPPDELCEYRENLYDRVEDICVRLDEILAERVPALCDPEGKALRLSRAMFHPLKCLFNALSQNLLNILRPCRALGAKRVGVFAPPPPQPQATLNLDADRFNLFFKLLQVVVETEGMELEILDAPRRRPGRRRRGALRLLGAKLFDKAALKLRGAFRPAPPAATVPDLAVENAEKGAFSALRVFIPKPRYSSGLLAEAMNRQGVGEVISPVASAAEATGDDSQLAAQLETAWAAILGDPRIAELFTLEGVALLPLAAEYLRSLLRKTLTGALRAYRRTRRRLAGEGADVMLLSTITFPEDFGMALAARAEGARVVTWQHGSYAVFDPHTQPAYYDIRDADAFLVFGEGTRLAFAADGRRWSTQIVPVGSAPLDRLSAASAARPRRLSSRRPRRPRVLVPLRGLNIPVIGDSYQSYPLDLYWRELPKMLEVFGTFPGLRFDLKLYPANTPFDNPIRDFLRTCGIRNVRLQHLRGFAALLPAADLVVLDWPYSTLLEAVCTSVPVICYRKYWALRSGVEEKIRRRCFLADSPGQLGEFLRQYADGVLPALDDRTLLREFGTAEDDGQSLTRGLRAIRRLCNQENANFTNQDE
jgi:hypothetical protein